MARPSAADAFAIGVLAHYLDQSNATSADEGFTASAAANYGVWSGKYTEEQCRAHLRRSAGFLVGARFGLTFDMRSAVGGAPDAVSEASGPVEGTPYRVNANVTVSSRESGEVFAEVSVPISVVVVADGNAKWLRPCE